MRASKPLICLGLYKVSATSCATVVSTALRMGFRRLDTAGSYQNEEQVGRGLTQSGIPRKDVYITTKISWNDMASEEQAYRAACESLKKLDVKYLDCLLLHFPARNKLASNSPLHADSRVAAWRAAERLVGEGRVRTIGVANFEKSHLTHLLAHAKIKPKVNQFELHPLLYQTQLPLIEFCREKHIEVEAYSALAMGKKDLLENPIIAAIGKSHHRSVTECRAPVVDAARLHSIGEKLLTDSHASEFECDQQTIHTH